MKQLLFCDFYVDQLIEADSEKVRETKKGELVLTVVKYGRLVLVEVETHSVHGALVQCSHSNSQPVPICDPQT